MVFLLKSADFCFQLLDLSDIHVHLHGRDDLTFVKGARLRGSSLQYVEAYQAFLVKADLRNANLVGANLARADMRNANLVGATLQRANLQGVDLRSAKLKNAYLWEANLLGADLRLANFEGADLQEANLQGADLREAQLPRAELKGATLQGADLRLANLMLCKGLTIQQIKTVRSLWRSRLDPEIKERVRKECPHLLQETRDPQGRLDPWEKRIIFR